MILAVTLWTFLRALAGSATTIALENAALRRRLAVVQRSGGRPRLRRWERIERVWLSRVWVGGRPHQALDDNSPPPREVDPTAPGDRHAVVPVGPEVEQGAGLVDAVDTPEERDPVRGHAGDTGDEAPPRRRSCQAPRAGATDRSPRWTAGPSRSGAGPRPHGAGASGWRGR